MVWDGVKVKVETYDPMIASMHLGAVSVGHCKRNKKLEIEAVRDFAATRDAYFRKLRLALGLAELDSAMAA